MKPLYKICFCLLLALTGLAANGAEPKRVLLIHSFGRGFEPYHTVQESFALNWPGEAVVTLIAELASRFINLPHQRPEQGALWLSHVSRRLWSGCSAVPGLASRPNRRSTCSISVLLQAKAKWQPAIVTTQENASALANRQAIA